MLETLGLGEVEERVYQALVSTSPATARPLAVRTGLTVDRTRRALAALADAGLAVASAGRPVHYTVVDPRVGLAGLIRERRTELDLLATAMETYSADYHERMLHTVPHHLVELIEGPTAITARLAELMAGAEREVLAFDTPPYVTADRTASSTELQLLARGVAARAMYASQALEIPSRAQHIRLLVAAGERARVLPRVPLKMVVVDGRDAVIPLTGSADGTRTTAALVRRSRLCDALVELFEALWVQAVPVFATEHPAGPAPQSEVHPDERALLNLLHAGLKDDVIARHLGVSERTLRRRVADLTTRLGVSSRFQAGAQAVRRGWL